MAEQEQDTATPIEATLEARWSAFLHWTHYFATTSDWDDMERDYKLEIAEQLIAARSAMLNGDAHWLDHMDKAFGSKNNLIGWRSKAPFIAWCRADPERAVAALRIIWDDQRDVPKRFNDFILQVGGDLDRIAIAETSLLHMANDPRRFPVFRAMPVTKAYKLVNWPEPKWQKGHDGERYEFFLSFLDEIMSRAGDAEIPLRDRLDAQSVVWSITSAELGEDATAAQREALAKFRGEKVTDKAKEPDPPNSPDAQVRSSQATAQHTPFTQEQSLENIERHLTNLGLRISPRTLRRYHLSLTTRGFVILAGVSGTGKTWLAESYADAVGAEHRLVSVAPNWTTNEDLLGFYNPVTERYHHTPTSSFIREAADAWHSDGLWARPYHLILDEMNLARVEYYFASFLSKMETRARYGTASIEIGDGDTLELTPNLYVIGTVNIDETTHGFADKVWDRAQLVELDLPREEIAAHIADQPYADDVLAIWDAVHMVGPFAYRVVDDIVTYIDGADTIGVPWEEALDEQILQKILPKLKGTNPDVVPALEHLVEMLNDRYPLSHERAQQMLEGIRQYGFASYFG